MVNSFYANSYLAFVEMLEQLTHMLDRVKKKKKRKKNYCGFFFFNM